MKFIRAASAAAILFAVVMTVGATPASAGSTCANQPIIHDDTGLLGDYTQRLQTAVQPLQDAHAHVVVTGVTTRELAGGSLWDYVHTHLACPDILKDGKAMIFAITPSPDSMGRVTTFVPGSYWAHAANQARGGLLNFAEPANGTASPQALFDGIFAMNQAVNPPGTPTVFIVVMTALVLAVVLMVLFLLKPKHQPRRPSPARGMAKMASAA